MSNAPSKPVSFSRPKVGYFSNRPRTSSPCPKVTGNLRYFYIPYTMRILLLITEGSGFCQMDKEVCGRQYLSGCGQDETNTSINE